MLAEADRLQAAGEKIQASSTAQAHIEGWLDPRETLLGCTESRPLFARAAELRREAEPEEAATGAIAPHSAVAAAVPSPILPAAAPRAAAQAPLVEPTDAIAASVSRWLPEDRRGLSRKEPHDREAAFRPDDGEPINTAEADAIAASISDWLPPARRVA